MWSGTFGTLRLQDSACKGPPWKFSNIAADPARDRRTRLSAEFCSLMAEHLRSRDVSRETAYFAQNIASGA